MSAGSVVLVSGSLSEEVEGSFVVSRGSICAMERVCVSF